MCQLREAAASAVHGNGRRHLREGDGGERWVDGSCRFAQGHGLLGLGDEEDAGGLGGAELQVFGDDDGRGGVLDLGGGAFATTSGRGHV